MERLFADFIFIHPVRSIAVAALLYMIKGSNDHDNFVGNNAPEKAYRFGGNDPLLVVTEQTGFLAPTDGAHWIEAPRLGRTIIIIIIRTTALRTL